jgi:hypothetical protein
MKKSDGIWYSGMEEPLFQRPIEWEVKGWMPIPIMQSPDVPDDGTFADDQKTLRGLEKLRKRDK